MVKFKREEGKAQILLQRLANFADISPHVQKTVLTSNTCSKHMHLACSPMVKCVAPTAGTRASAHGHDIV